MEIKYVIVSIQKYTKSINFDTSSVAHSYPPIYALDQEKSFT
jgi:hypothetical protein